MNDKLFLGLFKIYGWLFILPLLLPLMTNIQQGTEKIPVFLLFILMLHVVNDIDNLRLISFFSLCFYYTRIVFAICWFVYWGLYRGAKQKVR